MNALRLLVPMLAAVILAVGTPVYDATPFLLPAGWTSAVPTDINNYGVVVGRAVTSGGNVGFVWSASTGMQVISGVPASNSYFINDSGQIAGDTFFWNSGVVTTFSGSRTYGLTNSGQVIGSGGGQIYEWTSGGGMTTIGAGGVYGTSDNGNIVGLDSSWNTIMYTPGTGITSIPVWIPNGINNSGVAIGHHWPNGEVYDSVTATHSNVPFLPTGTWAENVAINNLGQITGEAGSSPSDWMGHAFVYINGVMVDLNTVTNGIPAGKTLLEGMFINDAGQIIVWTDSTNYLLLTPEASVPEPGTWWLVGLAVAAGRSLRRVLRRR